MPHGGARPGAGQPATNLNTPIDFDGNGRPTSIHERVVETIRNGAFIHDAAARVGFPVETLRDWRKVGQRALRDIVQGRRRSHELTFHERQCAKLARAMGQAEADAKMAMLARLGQLAAGMKRTETTIRTDASGAMIEQTVREITAVPDGRVITWWLTHRHPDDFGRQHVELSGPEGGPIPVSVQSTADKLRDVIESVRESKADDEPDTVAAGNGHSPNGTHA